MANQTVLGTGAPTRSEDGHDNWRNSENHEGWVDSACLAANVVGTPDDRKHGKHPDGRGEDVVPATCGAGTDHQCDETRRAHADDGQRTPT